MPALLALLALDKEVLRHELGTAEASPVHTLPEGVFDNLSFADDGTLDVSSFQEPVIVVIAPDGTQSTLTIGAG